jgi:hypothetical protein
LKIHKIPSQIIKGKLTPLNTKNVTGIALHHMANANWSVKDVENYHVNSNGWTAIGYNYWIGFDGSIYEGRGLNIGAHITGFNSTTVGIGFQGNFQSGTKVPVSVMTDEQFNAGVELIAWLKEQIPSIQKIGGHRDFAASSCPGDTFPLAEMIIGRKRGVKTMIQTAEQALDKIISCGAEIDRQFWLSACDHVKYLEELFIKIAKSFKE